MAAIFIAMRSSAGALARTTLTPRWRARGIEGLIGRVGLPSGRVRTWSTWSADCSRFPPGPTMWPGRSSSPDAPRLRSWSAAGANGVLQPAAVVDAQRRAPKSENSENPILKMENHRACPAIASRFFDKRTRQAQNFCFLAYVELRAALGPAATRQVRGRREHRESRSATAAR
jgi:hypothetical protein